MIIDDGRSFVRRNLLPFDLIVLPLTESLGASSTGLASLHEDYRLTTEAFLDYWQALKPGGFITVSLYLLPPPRGELRLVAVVKEALERMGKTPGNHLLAFRSWGTLTLLIKKDAVVFQEIRALRAFCQKLRFDLVYYPGMPKEEANIYNRFSTPLYFQGIQRVLQEGKSFYAEYPFDLSPATDDRPFFHHYFRWGDLAAIYRLAGEKWPMLIEGGYLVPVVFFLALFLSFLFIILPVMFGRWREAKSNHPERADHSPWLTYFASLGLGFMFVEISLIQKFILFLGHPVYAVSLVIFSLLIFAGFGSRLSLRMSPCASRGLKVILPLIISFLFLYSLLLPQILFSFSGATPSFAPDTYGHHHRPARITDGYTVSFGDSTYWRAMAFGGPLGLVRERVRIRFGLHSSGHHRLGLGISGGIFPLRPYLRGGSFNGLEIQLKRERNYGKV